MSGRKSRHAFVLAVQPSSQGFGWVVFEGPQAPYDWGICHTGADKNTACLKKVETLIDRFLPETLVLEAFEPETSVRSERIRHLGRALVALGQDRGVNVVVFDRAAVRATFDKVGAVTREEIAEAVARHIDAFRHRLPRRRKMWASEDERMALFSAAALAITKYRLSSYY